MTFAVNWDVANDLAYDAATAEQVYEWGFRGVRLKSFESIAPRISYVRASGLEIMAVATWESNGWLPEDATFVQIHNEMTTGQNPMSTDQYAYEWITYRNVFASRANYKWVTGGLAAGISIDLPWMRDFLRKIPPSDWPDAIALHLYTLTPQEAQDQCDRYWNAFQIPVAVTEWYRAAEQGHHQFQCVLGGPGLDGQGPRASTWNSVFCLSDHMTIYTENVHLGLLNELNQPKDEFYSLLSAPQDCRQ